MVGLDVVQFVCVQYVFNYIKTILPIRIQHFAG
jgi:hypothetical protein